MKETLEEAIATYGTRNQIVVAIEELSELQKELCKFLRNNTMENISEEIADVEIMLEQMIMIFSSRATVDLWKQRKLERLQNRLNNNEVL